MIRLVRCVKLAAILCLVSASTGIAADDVMPRVSIVHPGATGLAADLRMLIDLTNEREQKQWVNIEDFLEQFLGGVDRDKPIRVDVLLGSSPVKFLPSFPVEDLDDFRDNIDILGILTDADRRDRNLFKCEETFEGYMRFKDQYATFAEGMDGRNDLAPALLKDPKVAISALLSREFNIGAEVVNEKTDAASQDRRRKEFADIRDDVMSAIKKTPQETQPAFDLRRAAALQQLKEAERLLADTERLTAGWKMDLAAHTGEGVFDLTAIAGTDLAKTIDAFCQKPSMFGNIKRGPNSVLSLRVNHPLDELRQANLNELWTLIPADAARRIADSDLSDGEKTGSTELINHIMSLLKLGTADGIVDGFIEVERRESGKHTLLAAIRAASGSDLVKVVELIPQAKSDQKVELNVESVGETKLHKLVVATDYAAELKGFFGDDLTVWIATADSAIWFALGEDAAGQLKTALGKAAEENTGLAEDPAIDLHLHLMPLMKLRRDIAKRMPLPEEEKAATARKERDDLRLKAIEAMTDSNDVVAYSMTRVENSVKGVLRVEGGVLTLVGKLMAEFSAENLDLNN